MRITVLTQLAKGPRCAPEMSANIAQELQRVKWFLWHGNVLRARQTVDDLTADLADADASVESGKLAKAVREFGGYLAANASAIPNYGDGLRSPRLRTFCADTGYPRTRFDAGALAAAELLRRVSHGDIAEMGLLLAQAVPPVAPADLRGNLKLIS